MNNEVASEKGITDQIEKSSQKKLISMGNILEQFLLREAKEKTTAREYRTFLNEEFDRFFNESLKSPDEKLLTEWNEFRETIVNKIDGLLLAIEEEAEDAKGTLIELNKIMSQDSFYPSRDRVRGVRLYHPHHLYHSFYVTRKSLEKQHSNAHSNITKT